MYSVVWVGLYVLGCFYMCLGMVQWFVYCFPCVPVWNLHQFWVKWYQLDTKTAATKSVPKLAPSWNQVCTKCIPHRYQVGTKLVPSWYQAGTKLVSMYYQLGKQFGTNLISVTIWYQLGTKLVPTRYQGGASSRLRTNLVPMCTNFIPTRY